MKRRKKLQKDKKVMTERWTESDTGIPRKKKKS